MNRRTMIVAFVVLPSLAGVACKKDAPKPPQGAPHAEAETPTNRIEIPAAVRSNLGMTFAKVGPRVVARTARYPGRFEAAPEARREYRAPTEGRVVWTTRSLARVEKGDELFRIDAPKMRELARLIADQSAVLRETKAKLAGLPIYREAHAAHEAALKNSVELWRKRVDDLEKLARSGAARADELATARAESATAAAAFAETLEKDADLTARETELRAAELGAETRLASLTAEHAALASAFDGAASRPADGAWVIVRASAAGVVERTPVSEGAWVTAGDLVAVVVDPTNVRMRAVAPQSDLPRLLASVSARIATASGTPPTEATPAIDADLALEPTADADSRTIGLVATPKNAAPPWARPGVVAALEISPGDAPEELAIPRGAVLRDGLRHVFFRRDPKNPDRAIRVEADLGVDDGRYVVVKSGVREGDEVVLDGAFQLMLASSGTQQKGGHYHADGSFHADGEDK